MKQEKEKESYKEKAENKKKMKKKIKGFLCVNLTKEKTKKRDKNLIKSWLLDLLISTVDELQKPIISFANWSIGSKLSNFNFNFICNFIRQIMLLKCNYLNANGCKIVVNNTLKFKYHFIAFKNYYIWKIHMMIIY